MNNGVKVFFDRQMSRFDFFNPCSEEKFYSTGNQVCNGYIAMDNGGLTGVGVGNSVQKYLYLPESHTDFIFPIVVEEFGIIVGIIIIILLIIMDDRLEVFARNQYGPYDESALDASDVEVEAAGEE